MADDLPIEISTSRDSDITVLAPRGDVDMTASPVLRQALREAQSDSQERLIIDLGEVGYMDSSGVATLVEAMKRAKAQHTLLVLCNMNERVRAIFEIARLDKYFPIVDSIEAARRAEAS